MPTWRPDSSLLSPLRSQSHLKAPLLFPQGDTLGPVALADHLGATFGPPSLPASYGIPQLFLQNLSHTQQGRTAERKHQSDWVMLEEGS